MTVYCFSVPNFFSSACFPFFVPPCFGDPSPPYVFYTSPGHLCRVCFSRLNRRHPPCLVFSRVVFPVSSPPSGHFAPILLVPSSRFDSRRLPDVHSEADNLPGTPQIFLGPGDSLTSVLDTKKHTNPQSPPPRFTPCCVYEAPPLGLPLLFPLPLLVPPAGKVSSSRLPSPFVCLPIF